MLRLPPIDDGPRIFIGDFIEKPENSLDLSHIPTDTSYVTRPAILDPEHTMEFLVVPVKEL